MKTHPNLQRSSYPPLQRSSTFSCAGTNRKRLPDSLRELKRAASFRKADIETLTSTDPVGEQSEASPFYCAPPPRRRSSNDQSMLPLLTRQDSGDFAPLAGCALADESTPTRGRSDLEAMIDTFETKDPQPTQPDPAPKPPVLRRCRSVGDSQDDAAEGFSGSSHFGAANSSRSAEQNRLRLDKDSMGGPLQRRLLKRQASFQPIRTSSSINPPRPLMTRQTSIRDRRLNHKNKSCRNLEADDAHSSSTRSDAEFARDDISNAGSVSNTRQEKRAGTSPPTKRRSGGRKNGTELNATAPGSMIHRSSSHRKRGDRSPARSLSRGQSPKRSTCKSKGLQLPSGNLSLAFLSLDDLSVADSVATDDPRRLHQSMRQLMPGRPKPLARVQRAQSSGSSSPSSSAFANDGSNPKRKVASRTRSRDLGREGTPTPKVTSNPEVTDRVAAAPKHEGRRMITRSRSEGEKKTGEEKPASEAAASRTSSRAHKITQQRRVRSISPKAKKGRSVSPKKTNKERSTSPRIQKKTSDEGSNCRSESLPSKSDRPKKKEMAPSNDCEHRRATQFNGWLCTCGNVSTLDDRFCGMCGTKQTWTCSDCQHDSNLCIHVFCSRCGVNRGNMGSQESLVHPITPIVTA